MARPWCGLREQEPDATVEVLMTGLDAEKMKQFYFKEGVTAREVTQQSGIADFFPGATIDDYIFEPFGYRCL
jgi:S-adenosylmethionine decarboxylase